MTRLLDIRGLDAGYGAIRVVRNLSLHVDEGEIVALLGPNGAGKTTTLLTVSGLLPPLAGDARGAWRPVGQRAPQAMARRGLAHVPEGRSLFCGLTAKENVELAAGRDRKAAARALEFFPDLTDHLGSPGRSALRRPAADARAGEGAGHQAAAAHGRRDEPRPGTGDRRAPPAGAPHRGRRHRLRCAARRTARAHGARGRRPRLRARPRRARCCRGSGRPRPADTISSRPDTWGSGPWQPSTEAGRHRRPRTTSSSRAGPCRPAVPAGGRARARR